MPGDRLLGLLARNLLIGSVVAVGTVAGLLASDAHGIRELVLNDSDPLVAVLLLTFGFVVTLGSAAMGGAVMSLSREASLPPRGGKRLPQVESLRPAPARSAAAGRRFPGSGM
ncbi:hypothetical protein [Lutibaculum baratangense]|uniref:Uncharacterized protein n=1 Tax=Lutibaculum baratangense AMV1 TaxID=631454 RepID=V4RN06_9HYPH|nr:hypothetical protein [Lutibaculum baratangense]ESR24605.1 hypothetical protein N177_2439 [Lutibaculum baratangense AMV1]